MAVNYTGFSSAPQLVTKVTYDPTSVSANSISAQSITVPGVIPDMHFIVTAPSLSANLGIAGAYCTTAGTLVVKFTNPTGSPVDDVSQTFYILGL